MPQADINRLIKKLSTPEKSSDELAAERKERRESGELLKEINRRVAAAKKIAYDRGSFPPAKAVRRRRNDDDKRPAICYRLERIGMTQEEFAEMSHIGHKTVSRWCTGQAVTPRHILVWLIQIEAFMI